MSEPIHQDVVLPAPPAAVYAALTDGKAFAAFSGGTAQIETEVGGAFSLFDGRITGRTIEAIPASRLVQAWRAGNWDDGVYSLVRFDLAAEGKGTRLTLTHDAFPDAMRPHLEGGWPAMYWQPLTKHFT
ncbi:MAG: SRPBCC domain-containing protein [Alphaproteobacteria bacterium]